VRVDSMEFMSSCRPSTSEWKSKFWRRMRDLSSSTWATPRFSVNEA
jgi:hypothetical protein